MLEALPIEKILRTALKNGGDFADIFFESTKNSSVVADNDRIERVTSTNDAGLGLRVVFEGKTAYGYTNDFSEAVLIELAENVSAAVMGRIWSKDISLTKTRPEKISVIKIRPESRTLAEKAEMVRVANKLAWDFDKKIQQVSIIYRDSIRKIEVANSDGLMTEDEKIDLIFVANIVATDGKIIQTGYEPIGGFAGLELFDEYQPEKAVEKAAKRALMMLSARPAPAGAMPVVLSSAAGGTMVHEAVGHGLEADLAGGGFSVYQNKIGQMVANPLVTIVDDGTITGKRGTYSIDDEGTRSQRTVLIEKGILKQYMQNRISAEKMGCPSTGNGRRESYRHRPIVRMSNTLIERGEHVPAEIIKNTASGIIVKKMGGGQVNTITGDFVFEVQEGYILRNGEVCEPVRGATLSGNGPDILKKIDAVGTDLGYAIGTCGKEGQGVPVSDAQPTIRIPEIVVGGTG